MIEFGHTTHVGLRRSLNEDTYHADARLGLWLVADGMGGHVHGDVASATAREVIVREVRDGTPLVQAIAVASEEILRHARSRALTQLMGTTVVAARVHAREFELAWVGDSRAYLWREGSLVQLSADHSYVQELLREGVLSEEEAQRHPGRKMVTQALGVTPPSELNVACLRGELLPGMQLMLCSDGLTEAISDADIARILAAPEPTAQECCETLLDAALAAGGRDNITVMVLRRG